ncbi:MAG: IS1595 family transposase [Spirochaetota bacterium]|nr:IS1595 family transposase [Spirochaetota bacterium]
MASHFLLKSDSRTMSLKEIFKLTDRKAFEMFKSIRWQDGKPICPKCGCNEHYFISTRKIFTCKACRKQYSVTSNTIFADRKLPLQDYLGAIAIFTNGVKGYSALQLSRDLDVQYKTAYVMAHKLREAIFNHRDTNRLEGEIEIDVAWFGGYVKPENRKEDRIDRRLTENKTGKKRAILTIRKRGFEGAIKTLTFMLKSENQDDITSIVNQFVTKQSTIHADENTAYDLLHAKYEMKRVNHSIEYYNIETNACTNQAESFFSRMKRSQIGQHHCMDARYLPFYASEIAYREDSRRVDNGNIFIDLLFKALHSHMSLELRGYWKGNKRRFERIGA